eukprot:COSAG06_NODE_53813_length_298_cov_0.427136_1_plen_34_part_01
MSATTREQRGSIAAAYCRPPAGDCSALLWHRGQP